MKTRYALLLSLFLLAPSLKAQDGGLGNDPLTLVDQDGFYRVLTMAGISFIFSEMVFKEADEHYYQLRGSYYSNSEGMRVYGQHFGIEKRLSHWFGIGIEGFSQQWNGRGNSGIGMGLNAYYRWYAFGKKRWSPFLEYGTGGFYGFSRFPADGTKFTFHLTTSYGVEHKLKNKDRLRLTYGHLHQSNNDLFEANPGIDLKGFTLTYLWSWKRK